MAVTYVGSNSAQSSLTASLTVTIPAGTQNGDLLIAAFIENDNLETVTPPSGWTAFNASPFETGSAEGGIWYKFFAGGDVSPTWTITAAQKASAVIVSYRGVHPSTPFIEGAMATRAVSSTNTVAPSLTTTAPNQVLLGFFLSKTSSVTTASTPAGMTLRAAAMTTGGGATTAHVFSETIAAAGATGTRTVTYDLAGVSAFGKLLALNEAPAGGGVISTGVWGMPLVLAAQAMARFLGDPGIGKFYYGGREDNIGSWNTGNTNGGPSVWGSDSESAIAGWESRMTPWSGGMPLGIIRLFCSGSITTGFTLRSDVTRHHSNGRLVHLSFKLPSTVSQADAAAGTGTFTTWMDALAAAFTAYAPVPIWWTFNHEPENDVSDPGYHWVWSTSTGAADYRAVCRNIKNALDARGVTNGVFWTTGYMCPYTFGGGGGTRDWRWWYPDWKGTTASGSDKNNPNPIDFYLPGDSNAVVEGIGLDIYSWWNEGEPLSNYDPFEELFSWAHDRMGFLGLPYSIMEHGVCAYHTGSESGGTAVYDSAITLGYLNAIPAVMASANIVALQVYNYALIEAAWRLEFSDPSRHRYQGYGEMLASGSVVLPTQWIP